MVHHRQRLTLIGEAGQYLARIHAKFHDFKSYRPANGFALFGQVHGAHATFAQRSNDLIAAEIVIACRRSSSIDGLSPELIRAE